MYNKETDIMVSYDNAEAFSYTGEFVMSTGIRGFSLNAIRGLMAFEQLSSTYSLIHSTQLGCSLPLLVSRLHFSN